MSDQAPSAQATAAARARQAGQGVPLGGVGAPGSRVDTRSQAQLDAEARARQAVAVPTPLGGVNPSPPPVSPRESRQISTGGQPLGGVGPVGSTIPKGGGGLVNVRPTAAELLRTQAAARAAAAEAARAAQAPAPEPEPVPPAVVPGWVAENQVPAYRLMPADGSEPDVAAMAEAAGVTEGTVKRWMAAWAEAASAGGDGG